MAVIGPWTIAIQATATSLAVGAPVTITATTNHDIALTNYDTFILREDGSGWVCFAGTTCNVQRHDECAEVQDVPGNRGRT